MRALPLRPASLAAAAFVLLTARARADAIDEQRLENLFRPVLGEQIALSRDGKYLAYTQHEKGELAILVMDLEQFKTKTRILADEDRPILHSKEKQRAQLRFLDWADGDRLVFAPTVEIVRPGISAESVARAAAAAGIEIAAPSAEVIAPIQAVDADGRNPRELANARQFAELSVVEGNSRHTRTPIIRGFLPGKPRTQLLVETAAGGLSALFRLDVRTGKIALLHDEFGPGSYIYDRSGRARINRVTEHGGATEFFIRTGSSDRWEKLPAPPESSVRFAITPETYFGERAIMLGFDSDPNVLLYASNAGRDTFGVYGFDLKNHRRTAPTLEVEGRDLVALAEPLPSPHLVFDEFRDQLAGIRVDEGVRPQTAWIDPELGELQRQLRQGFSGKNVHLLAWNEARTRFLVQVTGGGDPGRTYLYRRPEKSMVELMRRAPWLRDEDIHETKFIAFPGPEKSVLTGYLTLPRKPRLNPPPLILQFASGLPPKPQPEFDAQAQVLADLGFVVCRLNQRGVLGAGRSNRDALRRDPNGAPAADALAAVEWIASQHRIDRKRVATLGAGFAGFFAIRAAEQHPEIFRCAIAFDPILNFTAWIAPIAEDGPGANSIGGGGLSFEQQVKQIYLEGGGAKLSQLRLPEEAPGVPVFAATRMPRNPEQTSITDGVARLSARLKVHGVPVVTLEYDEDFSQGLTAARARLYRALDEFLNLNLYNYDVKIGPTKVVR